jgi:outer membrane protein OmpA-like peptidoglycan-associated protein
MDLLRISIGRGTVLALALALGVTAWQAQPAESGRVVVTDTETTILDVVEFAPGTAQLNDSSRPILDAVAATLLGNPSIQLVEVQSHTSGIGDGVANQALSDLRAEAVVRYLVAAGVPPATLVAQGYGDTQPIDAAAPAKNERISFLILQRAQ